MLVRRLHAARSLPRCLTTRQIELERTPSTRLAVPCVQRPQFRFAIPVAGSASQIQGRVRALLVAQVMASHSVGAGYYGEISRLILGTRVAPPNRHSTDTNPVLTRHADSSRIFCVVPASAPGVFAESCSRDLYPKRPVLRGDEVPAGQPIGGLSHGDRNGRGPFETLSRVWANPSNVGMRIFTSGGLPVSIET